MNGLGSTSLAELPRSDAAKPIQKGNTINTDEFLAELKDASSAGLTTLPSRDIPTQPEQTTDSQVIQNAIPQATRTNYIEDEASAEQIIDRKRTSDNDNSYYNDLVTENYVPILASLLFFLSQLPTTRAFLTKNLPFCYHAEGEQTIQGMLIMSLFFGLSLVGVNYVVDNLI